MADIGNRVDVHELGQLLINRKGVFLRLLFIEFNQPRLAVHLRPATNWSQIRRIPKVYEPTTPPR
jgi:hypothetical protein